MRTSLPQRSSQTLPYFQQSVFFIFPPLVLVPAFWLECVPSPSKLPRGFTFLLERASPPASRWLFETQRSGQEKLVKAPRFGWNGSRMCCRHISPINEVRASRALIQTEMLPNRGVGGKFNPEFWVEFFFCSFFAPLWCEA